MFNRLPRRTQGQKTGHGSFRRKRVGVEKVGVVASKIKVRLTHIRNVNRGLGCNDDSALLEIKSSTERRLISWNSASLVITHGTVYFCAKPIQCFQFIVRFPR